MTKINKSPEAMKTRKLRPKEQEILNACPKRPPKLPESGSNKSVSRIVLIIFCALLAIPIAIGLLIILWPVILLLGIIAIIALVLYLLIFIAIHLASISATVNKNQETK